MRVRQWMWGAAAVATMLSFPSQAVTTADLNTLKPEDLVSVLTGSGITITNVTYTGSKVAAGVFNGGAADGLTINTGVILSTGNVANAAGPNESEGTSGSNGAPGDADLSKIVDPYLTEDAAILEFDVVTTGTTFSIQYVFASEEYKEYVGTTFNDVFAFEVDGQNIAVIPSSTDPVAVNSINQLDNSSYYNDNPAGSGTFGTQFDGFTTVLTAGANVTAGVTHHIRLAIADSSDDALDSAVFIAAGGISGDTRAALTLDPTQTLLSNGESFSFDASIFGVKDPTITDVSATGLPDDSVVTFAPYTIPQFGLQQFRGTLSIGADTPPGTYFVVVRGVVDGAEIFATMIVVVDCAPPLILSGSQFQPNTQTIFSGNTAALSVVPTGSGPYHYQWYYGHSGSTLFPVAGATSSHLTTDPLTSPTSYWVRVSNPCGTASSQTAIVTPATITGNPGNPPGNPAPIVSDGSVLRRRHTAEPRAATMEE